MFEEDITVLREMVGDGGRCSVCCMKYLEVDGDVFAATYLLPNKETMFHLLEKKM